MLDDMRPIGVFDSGLGGLTVVRALKASLPHEKIVYLGDTARVPYGTRGPETVRRYAHGCAELLVERDIKCLVVACNTASAVALESLRNAFALPVIGVVEPGARTALDAANEQRARGALPRVGVLATPGTIRSRAYERALRSLDPTLPVVGVAAPLLVPLAEEGWVRGEVPTLIVRRYLSQLLSVQTSVLVLGCTHYPLLAPTVSEVCDAELGVGQMAIVDGAAACARSVHEILQSQGLLSKGDTGAGHAPLEVLTTDHPESLPATAERFLGARIARIDQVDLAIR